MLVFCRSSPWCCGLVYIVRLMEHDIWMLDFNCLPNTLLVMLVYCGSSPWCLGLVYIVRLMEVESLLLDFSCLPNAL